MKKITIILLLVTNLYLILGCDFDQNKEILAEQKIGEFSRIVLVNTSSKPSFKFITDLESISTMPKWAPDKNNFAYMSEKNNKKSLWVSNSKGTQLEVVNYKDRDISNFEWAPNSKEIAIEFLQNSDEGNIFLYSLSQKSFLPITRPQKNASLGSWSPDSEWIVYNIEDSIYLSNPKGVNEIFITKGKNPKWSPNGEYVIFNRIENEIQSLWIYKNIDKIVKNTGKNVKDSDYFGEVLHESEKVNISEYDWAYGGNKILYINDHNNNNKEIYILDVKSKNIERLTNNKVDENNIVWSEKYRSILFISNAHNNSDIYQMKPDGSSQEIILNSKDSFSSLDW